MIYALLSQNFVVEIYALFPQNILDWGADSTNFFAFWMYGYRVASRDAAYESKNLCDIKFLKLKVVSAEVALGW